MCDDFGMTDKERIEELDELVICLQAEISAMKKVLFQSNPVLDAQLREEIGTIRSAMLEERRKKLSQ